MLKQEVPSFNPGKGRIKNAFVLGMMNIIYGILLRIYSTMPQAGIDPPLQSHAGSTFNLILILILITLSSLLGTLDVSILTYFVRWTYPVDHQVICIIQTMPSVRQDSRIKFN